MSMSRIMGKQTTVVVHHESLDSDQYLHLNFEEKLSHFKRIMQTLFRLERL